MRKLPLAAVLILPASVVWAGDAFPPSVRCFDFTGSITADDGDVTYYKTGVLKEWRALGPTDFVLDMPMPESYPNQAGVLKLLSERMISYCNAHPTDELARVEAFSLAEGPGLAPARPIAGRLALPPDGSTLRRNPLYAADGTVSWPSERYAREYGPHATYPARTDCPERATAGAATAAWALRREMVDLPERW